MSVSVRQRNAELDKKDMGEMSLEQVVRFDGARQRDDMSRSKNFPISKMSDDM